MPPLFKRFLHSRFTNTSTPFCTSLDHFQAPSSSYRCFSEKISNLLTIESYKQVQKDVLERCLSFSYICNDRFSKSHFVFQKTKLGVIAIARNGSFLLTSTGAPEAHASGLYSLHFQHKSASILIRCSIFCIHQL